MAFQRFLCLFLVIFTGLICTSQAYRFIVGGRDGWVLNPSENYNHWASRMRFQVNDTLFFKYKKGSDSVLVVNKDDYDKCNTEKPIMKMEDGDSVFKFDRSGPFFFISGNKGNCQKGQKLITVVLAVRNYQKPPPAPVGQTPAAAPPTGYSPLPAPATTPMSPSPTTHTPKSSPATSPLSPSPAAATPTGYSPLPAPATTPMSPSPTSTPTFSPATSPISPSPATSVISPTPAGAITPVYPAPANSPTVSPSATPILTPSPLTLLPPAENPSSSGTPTAENPSSSGTPTAENPSSSGNPTADINAPAPPRASAPAFTHSVVLVVLSVALGSFISAH